MEGEKNTERERERAGEEVVVEERERVHTGTYIADFLYSNIYNHYYFGYIDVFILSH